MTRLAEAGKPSKVDADGSVTLPISIASGYPVERWFGTEILYMKGARMQRLHDGAPVLFNHDTDQIIGSHIGKTARVDRDGVLRASVKLSPVTQVARDAINLYQAGHLNKTSAGYLVHKVREEIKRAGRSISDRHVDAKSFERMVRSEEETGRRSFAAFLHELDRSSPNSERRSADDGYIYHVEDFEPIETSLVGTPADPTVGVGRSLDSGRSRTDATGQTARAASASKVPGASGQASQQQTPPNRSPKGNDMAVQSLQQRREAVVARMNENAARSAEIQTQWEQEGYARTEEERTEVGTLQTEMRDLRDDRALLDSQIAASDSAVAVRDTEDGSKHVRGAPYLNTKVKDKDPKFQGQRMTQIAIAMALSKRDSYGRSAVQIAQQRWGHECPSLAKVMMARADVLGMGTPSSQPGHELITFDSWEGDFITFLYGITLFDQIPFRPVPANRTIKGQSTAASAYWTGAGKALPATNFDALNVTLSPLKVGAVAMVENELLEDATPDAQMLVRDALGEASAQRIDTTLWSTDAAVAGSSPAGLLHSLSTTSASAGDPAALRADLRAMLANYDTAKLPGPIWFVTTRTLARNISLMFNALGTAAEFPLMTPEGGSLIGYKVLVGDNVPSGDIIAVAPSEIYKIGDSGVQFAVSTDAMIEQSTTPTGDVNVPTAASVNFTSAFQEDSTAIRVTRRINFAKRRTSAVQAITGATYGLDQT